jgi:hypothetical protein
MIASAASASRPSAATTKANWIAGRQAGFDISVLTSTACRSFSCAAWSALERRPVNAL